MLGPIPLSSGSQGSGIWGTPAGTFPEGSWDITVRVTDPVAYETSALLEITMADVVAEDYVDPAAITGASAPVEDTGSWLGVAGLGVAAVAAVAVIGALLFRRSRAAA